MVGQIVLGGGAVSVRRSFRVFVVVVLVALGVVASPPAQAHVDACFGSGAVTTPPMFLPSPAPATGGMTLALPICVTTPGGMFAVGTISGWCGHAWGSATAAGHFFIFVIEGTTMTLSGSVTGHVELALNPLTCIAPGAVLWIASGYVVLAP